MTETNKQRNIELEWALAERKLAGADRERSAGDHGSALSLAYYSVFHYAVALLLSEGLEARTHKGLVHLLNIHFARMGRFDPSLVSLMSQLFAIRQDADYDAASVFTEPMADEWLARCRDFRSAALRVLESAGYPPVPGGGDAT